MSGPGRAERMRERVPPALRPAFDGAVGLSLGRLPAPAGEWLMRRHARNPKDFNQAIEHKMLNDRSLLSVMFADKAAARRFVAERAGSSWLTALYAHADTSAGLDWRGVPREYVAKVTHGCGGVIVVSETADPAATLPTPDARPGWRRYLVHPDSVTPQQVAALTDYWLARRFAQGPFDRREWVYGQIRPGVLLEQKLSGPTGLPDQLRIFCVAGRALHVVVERTDARIFEAEYRIRVLPWEMSRVPDLIGVSREHWEEVLRATEALAEEPDMLRVDWLVDDGRAYFSELTNYPAAGQLLFDGPSSLTPAEQSAHLRAAWNADVDYRALDARTRVLAQHHLDGEPV